MNIKHAAILGGVFNTITDKDLDQRSYQGEHKRTERMDWNRIPQRCLQDYKQERKGNIPDTGKNRIAPKNGRRSDKILLSPVICSKTNKVNHRRDSFTLITTTSLTLSTMDQVYCTSIQKNTMLDQVASSLTHTLSLQVHLTTPSEDQSKKLNYKQQESEAFSKMKLWRNWIYNNRCNLK